MLSQSSIEASWALAEKLAKMGITLRAVDDSPLGVLVNISSAEAYLYGQAQGVDHTPPDIVSLLMSGSTSKNSLGEVQHDNAMAEAVKMVSRTLEYNLDLARNKVNPLIQEVMTSTQAYMDQSGSSTLSPLNIVPFYLNPVWNSPVLHSLVERYQNLPVTDMPLRSMSIPMPGNMTEAAMTGAGAFDDEVTAYIASLPPDMPAAVWNAAFSATPVAGLNSLLSINGNGQGDNALLMFLFSRRLFTSDAPEGVNMSAGEWSAYLSTITSQAGKAVCRFLEKRAMDNKYSNLIVTCPIGARPTGDIVVNGEVYDRFLKEGGSPEVIFGGISEQVRGYRELLDKRDYFCKAWGRIYSLLQSTATSERYNALKEGLALAVAKVINRMSDDESPVPKIVLHERLRERMKHVKQKDMENLYLVSRKAICRVIFPHTDAEKMLLAIDDATRAHPEMEVREAALLAAIDFLSAWITSLFKVESSPSIMG